MSLRDWQKNSWLVEHKSSPDEIAALLAIVERDLANAKVGGLPLDCAMTFLLGCENTIPGGWSGENANLACLI